MVLQSTFTPGLLDEGRPGLVARTGHVIIDGNLICAEADGIAFGLGVHLASGKIEVGAGSAATFAGISTRDIGSINQVGLGLGASPVADKWRANEPIALLRHGRIWVVKSAAAIAIGGAVWCAADTGIFQPAAGGGAIQLVNARFEKAALAGDSIALVSLYGNLP